MELLSTPITGMACRFPGRSNDPEAFWELLLAGESGIVPVPKERWDHRHFSAQGLNEPGRTRATRGGFLELTMDGFDGSFFGLSGPEAKALDPQLKLLLEVTSDALENAGHRASDLRTSRTGVFIGTLGLDHEINAMRGENYRRFGTHTAIGMTASMRANRLSHAFDFRGPSMAIETACSSSLVALHLARQSILRGECDMAVVGAVNLMLGPEFFLALSKGNFLSPDSECFTFDARANGYVRGEGAAVVILEAADVVAKAAKPVLGYIRATAANHNGGDDGITVPTVAAQSVLTHRLLDEAGISPADVTYVEAHGTGTAVGDVVEAQAIGTCLGAVDGRKQPLQIGAVKGNIGHLEAVAGLAGLIKTLLVLRNGMVPGNRNFRRANPNIDFKKLNLEVASEPKPLVDSAQQVALVSAYGFGGANAQCLVTPGSSSAYPSNSPSVDASPWLLPFSASNAVALQASAQGFCDKLSDTPAGVLAGAAARFRSSQPVRAAVFGPSVDVIQSGLSAIAAGQPHKAVVQGVATGRRLVFLYSGMGSQSYGIGRSLLAHSPVFAQAMAECDEILRREAGLAILPLLQSEKTDAIVDPVVAQPLCVALQVGLTKWWMANGVHPDAVMGHSAGEMTAAWAAGLFSLRDALCYAARRGQIFKSVAGQGGMLAVGAPAETLEGSLEELGIELDVAAINGVEMTVLSGANDALAEAESTFAARNHWCRRLAVSVAYHSRQLESLEKAFRDALPREAGRIPQLPFFSTTLGKVAGEDAFDDDYWWANVREKVRFGPAVNDAMQSGFDAFLEISAHPALTQHLKSWVRRGTSAVVTGSLMRKVDDREALLAAVGTMYCGGVSLALEAFCPPASSLNLPSYPWRVQADTTPPLQPARQGTLLHRKLDVSGDTWLVDLSPAFFPDLVDHRVGGEETVPGVLMMQLARDCAREKRLSGSLEDIRFSESISLTRPSEVQVRTAGESVEIWARIQEPDAPWTRRATIRPSWSEPNALTQVPLSEIRKRCQQHQGSDALYERLEAMGLAYGESFRGLLGAEIGTDEVLARVSGNVGETAALDAALQAFAALADADGSRRLMPVGMARFHQWGEIIGDCIAWVRIHYSGRAGMLGDIVICDEGGSPLAAFDGVEMRQRAQISAHDPRMVSTAWRPYHGSSEQTVPGCHRWLIFPDCAETADTLVQHLTERNVHADVAPLLNRFNLPALDPFNPQDLDVVVTEAVARGVDAVAFFWGLAAPMTPSAAPDEGGIGLPAVVGLMHLVQALARQSGGRVQRLVIVTRSDLHDASRAMTRGGVTGFARVAASEHPELGIIHIDAARPMAEPVLTAITDLPTRPDFEYRIEGEQVEVLRLDEPAQPPIDTIASEPGDRFELCHLGDGTGFNPVFRKLSDSDYPLKGDSVEVRVEAFSLGLKDVMKANGRLSPGYLAQAYSGEEIGGEYAGTVIAAGSTVTRLKPGDKVVFSAPGGFRSHMQVPVNQLARLPDGWQSRQGPFLGRYIAAHYALVDCARLRPGERILIHSAATGMGLAALHLARHLGADVWASAGSSEKRSFLQKLGVSKLLSSRALEWSRELYESDPGQRFDVIIGGLSDEGRRRSFELLAEGGRIVEVGHRTEADDGRLSLPVGGNRSFISVDLDLLHKAAPERFSELVQQVTTLLNTSEDLPPLEPIETYLSQADEVARALKTLATGSHTGAVAIDTVSAPERLLRPLLDPIGRGDGTYLISGGLSGLGLQIARVLAGQGAGRLVLVGRSGAVREDAVEALESLRACGCDVVVAAQDITDPSATDELVCSIEQSDLPLRGVVHAATVYDDELITRFDRRRLRGVFHPKVMGAWRLHQATLDSELDFFVLMGSASLHLGNSGQSAYVAANAAMTALAEYRRLQGLPAQVLHWGVISGTGIGSRDPGVLKSLGHRGVYPLSLSVFRGQFSKHLKMGTTDVAIGAVDWRRWVASLGQDCPRGRYAELVPSLDTEHIEQAAKARNAIARLSETERVTYVVSALRDLVAALLGVEAGQLDVDRPLGHYGMDSLLAVQYMDLVQLRTGFEPGPSTRYSSSSLVDLATTVIGQMAHHHTPPVMGAIKE